MLVPLVKFAWNTSHIVRKQRHSVKLVLLLAIMSILNIFFICLSFVFIVTFIICKHLSAISPNKLYEIAMHCYQCSYLH
jgi:hypothetical protein